MTISSNESNIYLMKLQPSSELAECLEDFDQQSKSVQDDIYLSQRCDLTDYDESLTAPLDKSDDNKRVANFVRRLSELNTEDYEAFLRIVTRRSKNAIHPNTVKKIKLTKRHLKVANDSPLPDRIVMAVFITAASRKKADVSTPELKHSLSEQGHDTKDVSSGVNQMSKIGTPLVSVFKKSSESNLKSIALTDEGILRLNELISPRI